MTTILDRIIFCPVCKLQHLDVGEWRERPHRTHRCETTPAGFKTGCGHEWRENEEHTRGVLTLDSPLMAALVVDYMKPRARDRFGEDVTKWDRYVFEGAMLSTCGLTADEARSVFVRWMAADSEDLRAEVSIALRSPEVANEIIENLKRLGWTPPKE